MNRKGHENANFFTGVEVEHTPAFGKRTLFVVGTQSIDDILLKYKHEQCQHIFFGANHSFDPKESWEWDRWDKMMEGLLKLGIPCTLDIPVHCAETVLEWGWTESHNFIPQIRIPLPYIQQWNYNTMIKLDDKDFDATNPGVWCHNLHDLMDRSKYTDWGAYAEDKTV